MELTEKQKIEYLLRSYSAVDGLWFMKVEEKYGFDAALQLDKEVWEILPKIQARQLKQALGLGDGLAALLQSLENRLEIDSFDFEIERSPDSNQFQIIISKCPWFNLMVKSGRQNLAGKVGDVICNADYTVWASEFGKDIKFKLKSQLCKGSDSCILEFRFLNKQPSENHDSK